MPLRTLVLLLAAPLLGADPSKVLFIGNSYTGVNNLPQVYGEIAKSLGRPVATIKSSTPGGRSFENHLSIKGSTDLIDAGGWDVVVLQGQSMEAALSETDPKRRRSFLESAHGLCVRIRKSSPQARVVFYQTWARHADFWKAEKTKATAQLLGKDPVEMQARSARWYDAAAKAEGGDVAPAGTAWGLHYAAAPDERLHVPDNSHPNFAGTYLAALVIFGRTHGVPAPTPTWRGEGTKELPSDAARRLHAIAAAALSR